jgi:hypothetical protein
MSLLSNENKLELEESVFEAVLGEELLYLPSFSNLILFFKALI